MELTGRGVIVTGGGSGIGAALARRFSAAGAFVAIIDQDAGAADAVAAEVAGLALPGDVADPDIMPMFTAIAEDRFGRLDLVVLGAGRGGGQSGLDELDVADYRRLVAVNVDHVVFGLAAAVPALRRAGGGTVLATASLAGLTPMPGDPLYTLTEHAVVGYVRAAGAELADEDIRVCALCPGFVDTPLLGSRGGQPGDVPLLSAEDVTAAVDAVLAHGRPGEAWFVQPGRDPAPYEFPGVPGPDGGTRPPAGEPSP